MAIDWIAKLSNFLQVLAFTLAIAAVQYAFSPERPYGPFVVYSLCIGSITWAVIDLGRELFPSSLETGWPPGMQGLFLVLGGMVLGYLLGSWIANHICIYYGWYAEGAAGQSNNGQLRSSILVTALAGMAGSYYFYTLNKSAFLERKMTEARQHANESRLKLLETQLEPHMLFNTLANLRALISVDPLRAQTMLDHMVAYLRATLSASQATLHPLEHEFARLRDYLELMAVRMGTRLQYTLDLPDALRQVNVPPLLLQPLVENSIQHGLEPQVQGGSITVRASASATVLTLEVSDTGRGLDAGAAPADGKGFGLRQVRERLATLYGTAGAIEFVAGRAGGTRASITIPLKP